MEKTQSTKIRKAVLDKVRKHRRYQTIQGFIEQAIEERVEREKKQKSENFVKELLK